MNHDSTPIIDGMKEFHRKNIKAFSVPGHKSGKGIDEEMKMEIGQDVFYNDMAVMIGVDDRKQSNDYQGKAEELMADAYGADHCFFSTNGTSLSVHAAIMTVANENDKILVMRNCHFSMVAGIIISRVNPVFLEPVVDEEWDISHGVSPDYVEKMLKENPDAKGVFIVSPDYYGVCSDVEGIAKVCHKQKVPLIVDEAWGPHFAFSEKLPTSAIKAGADMAMGSMHKTMTALSQSSLLMLKSKLISKERFEQTYHLFETTSPSSLIMASMDASRRQMKLHGEEIWGKAIELANRARDILGALPGLKVMGMEVTGTPGIFDLDETKIVFDLKDLGISGFEAADWLWKEKKVSMELCDHRHLMALFTAADDEATLEIFINAMSELHTWASRKFRKSTPKLPSENEIRAELFMRPCDAYFGPTERVKLKNAIGRIAAETVSPYPPGIPRLIPGEKITESIVTYIERDKKAGMFQEDATDQKLRTIKVVK